MWDDKRILYGSIISSMSVSFSLLKSYTRTFITADSIVHSTEKINTVALHCYVKKMCINRKVKNHAFKKNLFSV